MNPYFLTYRLKQLLARLKPKKLEELAPLDYNMESMVESQPDIFATTRKHKTSFTLLQYRAKISKKYMTFFFMYLIGVYMIPLLLKLFVPESFSPMIEAYKALLSVVLMVGVGVFLYHMFSWSRIKASRAIENRDIYISCVKEMKEYLNLFKLNSPNLAYEISRQYSIKSSAYVLNLDRVPDKINVYNWAALEKFMTEFATLKSLIVRSDLEENLGDFPTQEEKDMIVEQKMLGSQIMQVNGKNSPKTQKI